MLARTRTPNLSLTDLVTSGTSWGADERLSALAGTQNVSLAYRASTATLTGKPLIDEGPAVDPLPTSDRIVELKRQSCLTWEQIARLFGVSKRAVMLWKSGGRMSAVHEERLTALLSRMHRAPSDDPIDTRAWLMTLDETGIAPYQRWSDDVRLRPKPAAWIDRQPDPR